MGGSQPRLIYCEHTGSVWRISRKHSPEMRTRTILGNFVKTKYRLIQNTRLYDQLNLYQIFYILYKIKIMILTGYLKQYLVHKPSNIFHKLGIGTSNFKQADWNFIRFRIHAYTRLFP